MKEPAIKIKGHSIRVYSLNTVIVGTGAAGLNAADSLWNLGQQDIAIVTEGMNCGTSRNTGSDKQTYYKLTLSGGEPDSVREMARSLFEGQCVDGDIALCEAALSVGSFFKLVELGVPFPRNRYGEYVGYKTDHDPRQRATSIGPYTSRRMTECLEKAVRQKEIAIFDKCQVIKILTENGKACGLLCLDLDNPGDKNKRFVAFNCKNIIYAVGGPAGIYSSSAYPKGHYGAAGIAFEAGVTGKNLTEWQYGLASVKPRWNVSGTYMQVLPRFISVDQTGGDEKEFLFDFFTDKAELLSRVFLKGYQWPFDAEKAADGSSVIDILVYLEGCRGRKVFLDYRDNPGGGKIDFSAISPEARGYLERAGACFGTPFERLAHMNSPAVDFYRDRGIDLSEEPLEIALCAQHNNGGLGIDHWWQTNLEGFFCAGEAAASHGVYRPGGSALNAGQVGSLRAAQYIAQVRGGDAKSIVDFERCAENQLAGCIDMAERLAKNNGEDASGVWRVSAERMSRYGAAIRNETELRRAAREAKEDLERFAANVKISGPNQLGTAFRLRDTLLCQYVYLSAMVDYIEKGGKSRGGALYLDTCDLSAALTDAAAFTTDDGALADMTQETDYRDGTCTFKWRQVRPIPEDNDFFENVWRGFRENSNVY